MAFHKEFRLLSCLLLLIYVAIHKGNATNQSGLEKSMKIDTVPSSREMDPVGECTREGEYLSDNSNCTLFYICNSPGDSPMPIDCPSGSLFNPRINSCDPDYLCPISPPECIYDGQVIPNYKDCSSYYTCYDNSTNVYPYVYECQDGTFFNVDNNICEDSGSVDCKGRPGCLYPGQNFAYVYNCSQYYICDASMSPILHSCPDGLSWDTETHNCIIPCEATCAMPTTNKEFKT